MKCNQFEEGEIPYGALEKFGLSHEMIEDLPMHVLEDIWNGRQSPVLPSEYSLSIGNESAEQFVNYKSEQLEKAMEEGNA